MNSMRKKKGISLIVLVITIVVMIILATAVILSLTGNGIIEKSNIAKAKSDLSNLQEAVSLKATERMMNDLNITKRYKLSEWGINNDDYEDRVLIEKGKILVKRIEKADAIEKAAEELGMLTKLGNTSLKNTAGANLVNYRIYGNSVQDGTPSSNSPFEIKNLGRNGKNLVDINKINKYSGYYWDGTGAPSGEDSRFIRLEPIVIEPNTMYKITSNLNVYTVWEFDGENSILRHTTPNTNTTTFTTSENCNALRISLYNTSGEKDTSALSSFQLERIDDKSEKYRIDVKVYGKNLINPKLTSNFSFTGSKSEGYKLSYYKDQTVSNVITVTPNTTLFLSGELSDFTNNVFRYGFTKEYPKVGDSLIASNYVETNKTIVVPENCYYLVWSTQHKTYDKLTQNVQLEEGTAATTYEPYVSPITTNIYLDEPLRKIGDAADYIDFKEQKIVRKVGAAKLDNSLTWADYTSQVDGYYKAYTTGVKLGNDNGFESAGFAKSSHFSVSDVYGSKESIGFTKNATYISISSSKASSVSSFKEWLTNNNIDVIYKLQKPTETSITLPNISTFRGTTTISVLSNNGVGASNIEVEY